MPSQNGRDLTLKIGNGGAPETFAVIGAARTANFTLDNQTADLTSMDSSGDETLQAAAGVQSFEITLDGLFKDTAAEEALRAAAFGRTVKNYQLFFPNGDMYAAAFIITGYSRSGSVDGLEGFSVTLRRSGGGAFTPGA